MKFNKFADEFIIFLLKFSKIIKIIILIFDSILKANYTFKIYKSKCT